MTMIEKVAEAMWQGEWARAGNGGARRVPWSEIAPQDQDRYRFVARFALEAMRTPTKDMNYVGGTKCETMLFGGDPDYTGIVFTDMGTVFTAMIDAALAET